MTPVLTLLLLSLWFVPAREVGSPVIFSNFPGGNVTIDSVRNHHIYLRPDLRDTPQDWFYWYFAVRAEENDTLHFHLNRPNCITGAGPAVSLDKGKTWKWLGPASPDGSFRYFAEAGKEIRFSMGMPYTQAHFDDFIRPFKNHKALKIESLCTTPKGRRTEKLVIGTAKGNAARKKVLITARHHACEMMTNYVLEGFLKTLLSEDQRMKKLLSGTEFWIIPFMDKDGVEDGDQGKGRAPRDHNRDYDRTSIYCSTNALRTSVPEWSQGTIRVALDLHCPWITGGINEQIYLVGSSNKKMALAQDAFGQILAKNKQGRISYDFEKGILPFGQSWNTARNTVQGMSFSNWADDLPGNTLSTSLEIPYSIHNNQVYTPEDLTDFGRLLAFAVSGYLDTL